MWAKYVLQIHNDNNIKQLVEHINHILSVCGILVKLLSLEIWVWRNIFLQEYLCGRKVFAGWYLVRGRKNWPAPVRRNNPALRCTRPPAGFKTLILQKKLSLTSAQRGQARSPWAPCPSSSWQVIMSSWQVIAISFPGGNVQLPEASSFARPGHASILEQCCSLFSLLLFLLFWWEYIIIIRIADHFGVAAVGCQTIRQWRARIR